MLLNEIAPSSMDNQQVIDLLTRELSDAKQQLKQAKQQASAVHHQGNNLDRLPHVARMTNTVAAITQKLKAAHLRRDREQEIRDAHRRLADVDHSAIKARDAEQRGEQIHNGRANWKSLYDQFGSEKELVASMYQTALELTKGGTRTLDVKSLADQYGVPMRTMYLKLESPMYAKIAQLMPKNQ